MMMTSRARPRGLSVRARPAGLTACAALAALSVACGGGGGEPGARTGCCSGHWCE